MTRLRRRVKNGVFSESREHAARIVRLRSALNAGNVCPAHILFAVPKARPASVLDGAVSSVLRQLRGAKLPGLQGSISHRILAAPSEHEGMDGPFRGFSEVEAVQWFVWFFLILQTESRLSDDVFSALTVT